MALNPATATPSNVASSTSSTALFASNPAARSRNVYNDSTAVLYLKFGTGASSTSYTVQLPAAWNYEFPQPLYTGAVEGAWASANGNARVTETA